jgi:nitrilase
VVGHYARPDVFKLIVNEEKKENIEWENKGYSNSK